MASSPGRVKVRADNFFACVTRTQGAIAPPTSGNGSTLTALRRSRRVCPASQP